MSKSIYDVAVIGAGCAGVVAARDLSNAGHKVVLLEARDRIGGRTYTGEAFGRQVEFGGGYAHWTQPYIWRELQRYGIGLNPPKEVDKTVWFADGKLHTGTQAEYAAIAEPLLTLFFNDARQCFPLPYDINAIDTSTIEQQTLRDRLNALNLSTYERDVLDGLLSTLVHSWDEQGVAQILFWAATYFGNWGAFFEVAGSWPIAGGTQKLVRAIHNDSNAELRLSTAVTAIEDQGEQVVITTQSGEKIMVKKALVALPLNVLSDLSITPEVKKPIQDMISAKHPMRTAKLWVLARGKVEPFIAFAPVEQNPINTVRVEYEHGDDSLLVCFISDESSIDVNDIKAVQEALQMFKPDIEVLEVASHNWVKDPFAQGTWIHHRPGNLTGAAPLIRKPHGNIYFAGGDIATMTMGGIEGAIESGIEAAANITHAMTHKLAG
ncbi:amine oxidase (flavin-containing) [Acinetobacter haemolyticus ATCC 19194]|uniref:Amine oxidase (Flavin-containing) n=1 Tax=Acinetobacter haemolyticus ATCC 19194 TaxID=707232 RepID=D4XNK3_ACIHA|nr:NAD(P)/FAD-dependent oxidoreductase [Acinetobacter haemolyticus]EFF83221.1 amine oxidase (flavin-containing) [Acinetobacter haemolyticus ATCC 19194]